MFSNRIESLQSSAIREIFKLMKDPNIIAFGGGNPSVDSFPIQQIKEISNDLFDTIPEKLLSYGLSEGQGEVLDELLSFFSRQEQLEREYDHTIITSGSQQGMDFLTKVLCNEGDTVICENPSFLGGIQAFKSNGAKLLGCNMEDDGLDLNQLEVLLTTKPKPKFIYVIPNFQNPTGKTMSLEKRKALYNIACKHDVFVLEDDPYGSIRFKGDAIPSIKSLDRTGHVIYIASMSKVVSPGMRVAIMVGREDVVSKCVIAKQVNDVHTNVWAQYVMCEFIKRNDMDVYLSNLSSIYKDKCEFMLECMDNNFSSNIQWTRPEGGMFIWVTLPDNISGVEFVKEAVNRKVAVVPGNVFFVDDTIPCQSFRVNYSMPSKADIEQGIKILGDLIKEMDK